MIKADVIIKNGDIVTLDAKGTQRSSVTVYKGRITGIWKEKVPPEEEIIREENVTVIDLQGATLLPGFIDTHNHLLMYAQYRNQVNCSTPPNSSISDIVERIKVALQDEKKEWIVGYGYDDTLLLEKRHPTRHDLDTLSTTRPIMIRHISGHFAVANTVALELAGLNKDTVKPEGGHLGKDENGELTGVLYELGAINLVHQHIPLPNKNELVQLIEAASVDYLAEGITTCTDAAVGDLQLDTHVQAIQEQKNPMKMRFMLFHYLLLGDGRFSGLTADEINDGIVKSTRGKGRLDSAKLFQDGSIQGLTGALREPYKCNEEISGDLTFPQAQLNEHVLNFHERGFRVATHGNGDRAIESIIEAYEWAIKKGVKRNHRHRIEHVQMASYNDLKKMKELNIAASFFINHIYYWGDRHRDIFVGVERAERMNPVKEAEDLGLLYTLHSDCPITPISPLFSVWAAVNRLTKDNHVLGENLKIDVETALKTMTIYGAELNFEEDDKGTIEIGKAADFVVLQENPLKIKPEKIKDIAVLKTIIDGTVVYSK